MHLISAGHYLTLVNGIEYYLQFSFLISAIQEITSIWEVKFFLNKLLFLTILKKKVLKSKLALLFF